MLTLEVREMGETLVVELPAEMRKAHNIKKGDRLYAEDGPDEVRLSVHEPGFERQMRLVHKVMEDHQDALRELADK